MTERGEHQTSTRQSGCKANRRHFRPGHHHGRPHQTRHVSARERGRCLTPGGCGEAPGVPTGATTRATRQSKASSCTATLNLLKGQRQPRRPPPRRAPCLHEARVCCRGPASGTVCARPRSLQESSRASGRPSASRRSQLPFCTTGRQSGHPCQETNLRGSSQLPPGSGTPTGSSQSRVSVL